MTRLLITVEGQTELAFVETLLAPHLAVYGVYAFARSVLTSRDKRTTKEYRGGLQSYQKARADILSWMKEDRSPECRFTTMFDLYALPRDFPGFPEAERKTDPYERIRLLENEFAGDIKEPHRFFPYVQLHEFETFIFADPQKLALEYMEHDSAISRLVMMAEEQNPELIDDGPESAPSKRIIKEIPEYRGNKLLSGVPVVQGIGIPVLREKCKHFNEWLLKLERLVRT